MTDDEGAFEELAGLPHDDLTEDEEEFEEVGGLPEVVDDLPEDNPVSCTAE